MELTFGTNHEDTLLVEMKIQYILMRARILNASPIVSIAKKRKEMEKEKKEEDSRQVEEIRMLDDILNDLLASLDKALLMKLSLYCNTMLVILLLLLAKHVLLLLLLIMLYKKP
jgi:hypothetical protein